MVRHIYLWNVVEGADGERAAGVGDDIALGADEEGLREGGVADAPERLGRYIDDPAMDLVGAFSHLAAAEELDSTFTQEQLSAFATATRDLPANVERHIAATAAGSAASSSPAGWIASRCRRPMSKRITAPTRAATCRRCGATRPAGCSTAITTNGPRSAALFDPTSETWSELSDQEGSASGGKSEVDFAL